MADHKMNPNETQVTGSQLADTQLLDAQLREAQLLDARITLTLETTPKLQIPADFAAKVAAQVPAIRPVTLTPRGYGRNAAIVSMAVLLALMLVFAHRTGASPLWTTMEWVFCAQFALVAVWLAVRQGRPRLTTYF